jgi:uncharacterized protein (DUF1778 family)
MLDYPLGADVTRLARSPRKTRSVVLSIRLTGDELTVIEQAASAEDRTLSYVVRRAVREWAERHRQIG